LKDVVLYLDDCVLRDLSNNTGSLKNVLGAIYLMLNYPVFRGMGTFFWNMILNALMELPGSIIKV